MFCRVLNYLLTALSWALSWLMSGVEQDTLQAISSAFLTILIPVAIAIFEHKKEFEALDRNVILDYLVKAKSFLLYLGLIFLPLLFWSFSPRWLRFAEMVLWVIGIGFMSRILVKSYDWIKGDKFSLRFNYLKRLNNVKNTKDMEKSWRSVWQTKKINPQNEKEFFEIFSSTIEQLLQKDNESKS